MNALAHYYAAAESAFHEIFYQKLPEKFFAELFQKSTVIFPEISGKIPQEISELPTLNTGMAHSLNDLEQILKITKDHSELKYFK